MPERGRGPSISVRVVGEGLPGKVLFEHRSEESEGTYQWNLRDKLSGQRAESAKPSSWVGGSVAHLMSGTGRKLMWRE